MGGSQRKRRRTLRREKKVGGYKETARHFDGHKKADPKKYTAEQRALARMTDSPYSHMKGAKKEVYERFKSRAKKYTGAARKAARKKAAKSRPAANRRVTRAMKRF